MPFYRSALLLSMLCCAHLHAQDTVSVFFEFGISKVSEKQRAVLRGIPVNYDLSELDSAHFIGMADPVGSLHSNFKLSEKRARNVHKICRQVFLDKQSVRIMALGEKENADPAMSRRVDVVLFSGPVDQIGSIDGHVGDTELVNDLGGEHEEEEVLLPEDKCHYIAYDILHRAHIRRVKKGRKEWVLMEAGSSRELDFKDVFAARKDPNGKTGVYKVRWKKMTKTENWWGKERRSAKIRAEDFDLFKIFRISDPPCGPDCDQPIYSVEKAVREDTCMQTDRYLMHSMQLKNKLFSKYSVKGRVPREYVITEADYFVGCDQEYLLHWYERKGKKKQRFLYADLPIIGRYVPNIVRVMDCCDAYKEASDCAWGNIRCNTVGFMDTTISLNMEIAGQFQGTEFTPYAALSLSRQGWYSRSDLLVGTDSDLSLFGLARYQLHLVAFPWSILSPTASWQTPAITPVVERFGIAYAGTELKGRLSQEPDYLEWNLHVGLADVNTRKKALFTRFFIQSGIGFDFTGNLSSNPYWVLQFGTNIDLVQLKG